MEKVWFINIASDKSIPELENSIVKNEQKNKEILSADPNL